MIAFDTLIYYKTEMTQILDKNETVKVQPVDTTEQKPPEKPVVKEQSKPKKKVNWGARLWFLLKLSIFLVAALLFMIIGFIIGTRVIPGINQWFVYHRFWGEVSQVDVNKDGTIPPLTLDNQTAGSNVADVVSRVSPGVVSIAIANADLNQQGGVAQTSDKIGTGFVIDASGIIVTNQHVVRDTAASYQVITSDNKVLTPTKIVRDAINDIALIFVDSKSLKALTMGDSEKIRVGETAIAIGTPLGEFPGSVTVGVISGLGRNVKSGGGFWGSYKDYENVLQTDAAVNPGNSGGPLINSLGEVIGVNFATTNGAENISFALPINLVKQRVAEYKQYGKFKAPFLGISGAAIGTQESKLYSVPEGVLVRSVAQGSPAEVAGIKVGDIITKIDGNAVSLNLTSVVQKLKIDSIVTVVVWRQTDIASKTGKEMNLQVKIGEAPQQ